MTKPLYILLVVLFNSCLNQTNVEIKGKKINSNNIDINNCNRLNHALLSQLENIIIHEQKNTNLPKSQPYYTLNSDDLKNYSDKGWIEFNLDSLDIFVSGTILYMVISKDSIIRYTLFEKMSSNPNSYGNMEKQEVIFNYGKSLISDKFKNEIVIIKKLNKATFLAELSYQVGH